MNLTRPMASARFYCPIELVANSTTELPPEVAHHAVRVLRLKPGADIRLFNGSGGYYNATLDIEGKSAFATISNYCNDDLELPGCITLVQGMASGDKMDWIIEKAVELGVRHFVPVAAQRSVLQLNGERLNKRMTHWQRVIRSASEQCGRNRLMHLHDPVSLQHHLGAANTGPDNLLLFCHPEASTTLAQALLPGTQSLTLLVGPEGGWSHEEQKLVSETSAQAVTFGRRVLRTETAGLALAAACSALMGWE
jgi:16S rRNA (uracil1498-N3)-methyltransferase